MRFLAYIFIYYIVTFTSNQDKDGCTIRPPPPPTKKRVIQLVRGKLLITSAL
jgi:hypothetical protein